jgi:hypothetical protein
MPSCQAVSRYWELWSIGCPLTQDGQVAILKSSEVIVKSVAGVVHSLEKTPTLMGRTFCRPCPQCAQLVIWPDTPTYPFCSERCRLIDLGVWARGDYRIPGEQVCEDEPWSESALEEGDEEAY